MTSPVRVASYLLFLQSATGQAMLVWKEKLTHISGSAATVQMQVVPSLLITVTDSSIPQGLADLDLKTVLAGMRKN